MAEEGSSEKTEEPTARKLQKAREEGQVARSVELPTAVLLVTATLFFTLMGSWMFKQMGQLFTYQLAFDRKVMDKAELMPSLFAQSLLDGFLLVLPIMLVLYVMAIISSGLTGGFIFSMQLISPKFNKLNPLSGLARMFGMKALIELAKSIGKFVIVGAILLLSVMHNIDDLLNLNRMDLGTAVRHAGEMIIDACFWMSMGLVLIAVADVPLQRYQVHKKLKMTKQEIKDEMKDMEGRPEVKAQIRRRQREMSNARMIDRVKDADVVITNPEHFAVALSYDPNGDSAPILLAKGADAVAARIREEAEKHGIEIFQAPPLARALYFTTDLERPVPEDLYYAVAQVIAYIFNLASVRPGAPPVQRPQPKVPPNMQFDANGKLETEEATT